MNLRVVFATLSLPLVFTGVLCAQSAGPAAMVGRPLSIVGMMAGIPLPTSNLEISAYAGIAVDTFTADEVQKYLNYDASTGNRERGIGGIDFVYRINDPRSNANTGRRWLARFPAQLVVFGETLYGVRSTEIDCTGKTARDIPVCVGFSAALPERSIYIMRNASSVEGYGGMRFEFLRLHEGEESSANLYIKTQFGFQQVAKGSTDIADDHLWAAFGGIINGGDFRNSYVEVGKGRSDVFAGSRNRWKIDGYVEFPMTKKEDFWIRPFAQIYLNIDGGNKADSIQSFFGFNFDVRKLRLPW